MVARTDLATDPAVVAALADVRLGTAGWRRALGSVTDAELDGPSLLAGWDRRHLVAHVGYNARAVARLVTWAATGEETPMYASPAARNEEIELGATLRPEALRSLSEHAATELDVRWRDLPDDRWGAEVVTAQGRTVPVSETLWMRAREVWLHAVDLDTGVRVRDLPEAFSRRLLGDVTGMWQRRDDLAVRLVECDGRGESWGAPETSAARVVTGDLPALVAWATGRVGARVPDVREGGRPADPAPRWL